MAADTHAAETPADQDPITTTNSHGPETPLDPIVCRRRAAGTRTSRSVRWAHATRAASRFSRVNAFLMIFLGFIGVAAVLIVIAVIIMKMGGPAN